MPQCGTIVSHACKKLKLFEPKHGKNYQKYPMVIAIDQHWWKISKVQTWKTREKIPKIQTHMIFNEVWANPKHKKNFFLNDLKYLQFTIEVYGKNWYIAMYHAQTDLVWASKSQARLKNQKILKLKNQYGWHKMAELPIQWIAEKI